MGTRGFDGTILRRRHAGMFTEFADQMRLIGIPRSVRKPRKIARAVLRKRVENMREPSDTIVAPRRIPHEVMKQFDEMPGAQFDLASHIFNANARTPGSRKRIGDGGMHKKRFRKLRQKLLLQNPEYRGRTRSFAQSRVETGGPSSPY